MKRVVFVTASDTFFLSHRLSLAKALKDSGFEVVVAAASTGAAAAIESNGMRFIALPLVRRSMSVWTEARAFLSILVLYYRERPDLAHHSSIKPILYGSYAARLVGLRAFVNTVSGLGYALTKRPSDQLRQRVLRRVISAAYRFALRGKGCWNIFQNPDQLQRFVQDGLADPKCSSLIRGAGVNTELFHPTPLPIDTAVVLLPARLLWDKGVGEFVHAARALRGEGVSARFVLVGKEDPENRASIPRETIDDWLREGVIEWWGHRDDMSYVFTLSHLVVLPSYAEGLPLALAEAAASGRACIATDVAGCRDAVIDGVTGWLVPAYDADALKCAIRRALDNSVELIEAGRRGRLHAVTALSQDYVLRETFQVIQRLGFDDLLSGSGVKPNVSRA